MTYTGKLTSKYPINLTLTPKTGATLLQAWFSFANLVTLTPSDLSSFVLNDISFYSMGAPTSHTGSNLNTFPKDELFQPLKRLYNILTGVAPNYTDPIIYVDLRNNVGITSVPESFCTLYPKLEGTSIVTVPDCFYCYQTLLLPGTLPTTVVRPSDFQCTTISWSYSDVSISQVVGGLNVTARNVEFNSVWTIVVSGYPCNLNQGYDYAQFQSAYCTVPHIFPEGQLSIDIVSDITGTSYRKVNFSMTYPYVTAIDPITTAGGLVTIHGSFGANLDTPSAAINNINCPIDSLTTTTLICHIGQVTKGPASFSMLVDGYPYQSNSLLYITETDPIKFYQIKEIHDGGGVVPNNTNPTAQFEADGFVFEFSLYSVRELGPDNQLVKEVVTDYWNYANFTIGDLTSLNYTFNNTADPYAPETVTSSIQYSTSARTLDFAGITMHLSPNTLKVSVSVVNWQYSSSLNTLQVVFTTKLGDYPTDCNGNEIVPIQSNELDDSIEYLKVIRNGLAFYGKFLDRSLSDGRPTYTRNRLLNITQDKMAFIGISMPQCKSCLLDPNFNVLIDNGDSKDKCSKLKLSTWKIIVIAVGGFVALVAVIVGLVLWKKNRKVKTEYKNRMSQKLEELNVQKH
eukprot:gene14970-17700_t